MHDWTDQQQGTLLGHAFLYMLSMLASATPWTGPHYLLYALAWFGSMLLMQWSFTRYTSRPLSWVSVVDFSLDLSICALVAGNSLAVLMASPTALFAALTVAKILSVFVILRSLSILVQEIVNWHGPRDINRPITTQNWERDKSRLHQELDRAERQAKALLSKKGWTWEAWTQHCNGPQGPRHTDAITLEDVPAVLPLRVSPKNKPTAITQETQATMLTWLNGGQNSRYSNGKRLSELTIKLDHERLDSLVPESKPNAWFGFQLFQQPRPAHPSPDASASLASTSCGPCNA